MQRRGESKQPTKGQRTSGPKARKAPTARVSTADLQEQVAALTRELTEAREQQTATSEVLKVISSSPGELQPVFMAMLENAVRICEAKFGTMFLCEGAAFRIVAMHNAPPAFAELRRREPVIRAGPLMQVAATKQLVHISDLTDPAFKQNDPATAAFTELTGVRTVIVVPMLKDQELVGTIGIYRRVVSPFSDKQIKLLQNFAAQAVIAIENTQLLKELRESLQQQTATADVLKIISSSPGDLRPVFETMLAKAVSICEAKFGTMNLYDAGAFRTVAMHDVPPAFAEMRRSNPTFHPSPRTGIGRAAHTKQVVHILDLKTEQTYREREPASVNMVELAGARTLLTVPMLKEGVFIGGIAIYRQEVRPFTEKQIELVQNFASQAVIAIENARLLNELRQRTDDLTESLEQQTATSEVLRIISSSPGELEPVFQAMLENATRICEANCGTLVLYEGDAFRIVAMHGAPIAFSNERQRQPVIRPERGHHLLRLLETKKLVHIADISVDPALAPALAKFASARTLLTIPMLKENELVGAIGIYRQEVRLFTDRQIELVTNFAAQAVVAIENVRLLNDLNKLNQQLEQRVSDQVSEIERMSRLRRFLPAQVADLIVASGAEKQLESHRQEITALFCDLRGFTGFSESSDPEDVMALLRGYHAAIGEIINKYGGTLERYAGDGVMVVFNDPIPVDNPALQAVLMAVEMRAAIEGLIEKWRKLGHEIGFGIGIAHGFATLGTIGFEGRFDYAAIGTVSNVASRLCDEAKPGQILISPRVLMAVEKDITVEPVGEFELKGIRRPLTAYNVLATKAAN
jgi:class 3 adenylate cyclase/putative methionine-R-sulfoxide reductase with GAF domain